MKVRVFLEAHMFYYLVILGLLVYVFYWDLCILELRIKYIISIIPLVIEKIYLKTIVKYEKSLLRYIEWHNKFSIKIEQYKKKLEDEIDNEKKTKS